MIPDDVRILIDRLLDGDLDEREFASLYESLDSNADTVGYLADRSLLHSALSRIVVSPAAWESSAVGSVVISAPGQKPSADSRSVRPGIWGVLAAAICVIGLSFILLPRAVASPAQIVRRVLSAHDANLDRRYLVQFDIDLGDHLAGARMRARPAGSTLWVRGQTFVQIYDVAGSSLAWGRDEAGAVWFAINRKSLAVFDADEIPEALREICEMRTLELPSLLKTLLSDFDLEYLSRSPDTDRIRAIPLRGTSNLKYRAIEAEIERESLLVRKVSMERMHNDRRVAVITFSLQEAGVNGDSRYKWKSHLAPDGQLLLRGSRRGGRAELLREFLQILRQLGPGSE